MKPNHYFPSPYQVEVGTANRENPKPGFRWVRGYSEATPDGGTGQPIPRQATIHRTEAAARKAAES